MRITKIEIENFKSFSKVDFSFNNVNVLIGANASGKSNFVQIFDFLKTIKESGIEKAMAEMGGIKSIVNFNTEGQKARLKIFMKTDIKTIIELKENEGFKEDRLVKTLEEIIYEISFRDNAVKNFDFKETITFVETYAIYAFQGGEIGELKSSYDKKFHFGVSNDYDGKHKLNHPGKSREVFSFVDNGIEKEFGFEFSAPFHTNTIADLNQHYSKRSLLEYSGVFMPSELFNFGVYDINCKVLKNVIPNRYESDLKKDGSNLVLVIKHILEDEEQAEQFIADIGGVLEFIDDIKIYKIGNFLDIEIKENFKDKKEVKGSLLSDGTVSILALIVALYYQDQSILFIEELERSIHPSLIDDLINRIYNITASLRKQVIITTHNPELLRHIDLEDLFLISRDENNGNSIIEKPMEKEMVKAFLENELGIDELYVQNLLND